MRILQTSILSPWDPRHGGGQLSVHDLASALVERGHDVTVLYSGASPPGSARPPYRCVLLPFFEHLYLNPLRYAAAVARLAPGPDVVHSNGYEGAFFDRVLMGRAALVATTRHPDLPDLRGAPRRGWTPRGVEWRWRHLIAVMERRALRRAHRVVCVSGHSEKVLRNRGYLDPSARVSVVHNGGRPFFGGRPDSAEGGNLLCIARLDRHKGLDVLIQALARTGAVGPNLDLVGHGPLAGELEALAVGLGIRDRIRFHGYVEPEGIPGLLKDALALILPSRSENFPRVILDAMRAGIPIVSTSAGGIPEAVRDGVEAILVPPGDPGALSDALRRVVADGALREALGAAALRRGEEFTWAASAEKLEGVFLELRGA